VGVPPGAAGLGAGGVHSAPERARMVPAIAGLAASSRHWAGEFRRSESHSSPSAIGQASHRRTAQGASVTVRVRLDP
jgi:hypothetical protein